MEDTQDKTQEYCMFISAEATAQNLSPEVQQWLDENCGELADIVEMYSEKADVFNLCQELRDDPTLILKTIIQSADTLYKYQQAYNQVLAQLARIHGLEFDKIEDIPLMLQEASIQAQSPILQEHLKNGGNVAIALNGSGASGKGTIAKKSGMKRAVNTTTRPRRPGEESDIDYHYIAEMEEGVNLDKDTGFNIVGTNNDGSYIFEMGENGKPVDYFEKYGPYVVTVHRPGRARHGTSLEEFTNLFDNGERAIFFEHGPVQVLEAGKKLPELIPNAKVLPVCVLPPRNGILPLASRIVARTYGDPEHLHPDAPEGVYKITDTYLESTIGMGQIAELGMTAEFAKGENPLGVVYIVNDDLMEAVKALKGLISIE